MADNEEAKDVPTDSPIHVEEGQPLSEVTTSLEPRGAYQLGQPLSEITVSDSAPVSEIRPTPPPDSSKKPPSEKK